MTYIQIAIGVAFANLNSCYYKTYKRYKAINTLNAALFY